MSLSPETRKILEQLKIDGQRIQAALRRQNGSQLSYEINSLVRRIDNQLNEVVVSFQFDNKLVVIKGDDGGLFTIPMKYVTNFDIGHRNDSPKREVRMTFYIEADSVERDDVKRDD